VGAAFHNAHAGLPTVILLGDSLIFHECGTGYTDAGAIASDPEDGDLTNAIVTNNGVNAGAVGNYSVSYDVTDSESNAAPTVVRDVVVLDTVGPFVTLIGADPIELESKQQGSFTDPGATSTDGCSPANPAVTLSGAVEFAVPSAADSVSSTLAYTATDDALNSSTVNRTVNVFRSEPVLGVQGAREIVLNLGEEFTDPGVTVHDVQEGDASYTPSGAAGNVAPDTGSGTFPNPLTVNITRDGVTVSGVDTAVAGKYEITYAVSDSDTPAHDATPVGRVVRVGPDYANSNFTMIQPNGVILTGGANDIAADFLGNANADDPSTLYNESDYKDPSDNLGALPPNMEVVSATPTSFFGQCWRIRDVRAFGPGTYTFDACPGGVTDSGKGGTTADGSTNCADPISKGTNQFTVTVPPGHIGAHILFDWPLDSCTTLQPFSNTNRAIDVFQLWKPDSPYEGQLFGLGDSPTWNLASVDMDGDGLPGRMMLDGPFQGHSANFNLQDAVPDPFPISPVVNAGLDQTVVAESKVTLEGSAADADGEVVSYLWEQIGGAPVTLEGADSTNVSFTAPAREDTLLFHLIATDDDGNTSSDVVAIVVAPKPEEPTVDAGVDQTVTTGSRVTLQGIATDTDGEVVGYLWEQVGGLPVALGSADSANASFTAPDSTGTLIFRLTVTDDTGLTNADIVNVEVILEPVSPSVEAGPDQTVKSGSSVMLEGGANDEDGEIVGYQWTQTGGPPVELNSANSASASFVAPTHADVLTFKLTATDNDGLTDSDRVTITITGGGGGGGSADLWVVGLLIAAAHVTRKRR
jgi:hypothetical protein